MNLIVALYDEPILERREEILSCLKKNLELNCIWKTLLILEDKKSEAYFDRIHWHMVTSCQLGHRVSYAEAFSLAARYFPFEPCVFANNDIEFDESLVNGNLVRKNELWCISRTEPSGALYEPTPGRPEFSQDAWIFRPPLPSFWCDWHLGIPGCENRLAYEATHAGISLSNPASKIRALHRHVSNVRRPSGMIEGPHLYVKPT